MPVNSSTRNLGLKEPFLFVEGGTFADGSHFWAVDISHPETPEVEDVGTVGFPGPLKGVKVSGTTVYASGPSDLPPYEGEFYTVNVEDPQNPQGQLGGHIQQKLIGAYASAS